MGAWRVAMHLGDSVPDTELSPVFAVTGAKQPGSCDDVSVRRSSIGLFAAAASGDGYDVTVKVVDNLNSPSRYESPYVTVTRNEPEMLRLVVTASGGVESQRKSYANEVLRHAKLERVGDPASLKVDWPSGLKQQASGIPWQISGELVNRAYRYDSDADSPDVKRLRLHAAVAEPKSVGLYWTKVDPLTGPSIGSGFWFAFRPDAVKPDIKTAHRVIDGYLVTVVDSGVTQAELDTLVNEVHPISLQCPEVQAH